MLARTEQLGSLAMREDQGLRRRNQKMHGPRVLAQGLQTASRSNFEVFSFRNLRVATGLPALGWFVISFSLYLAPSGHAQTLQRRDAVPVADVSDTLTRATPGAVPSAAVPTAAAGAADPDLAASSTNANPAAVLSALEAKKAALESLIASWKAAIAAGALANSSDPSAIADANPAAILSSLDAKKAALEKVIASWKAAVAAGAIGPAAHPGLVATPPAAGASGEVNLPSAEPSKPAPAVAAPAPVTPLPALAATGSASAPDSTSANSGSLSYDAASSSSNSDGFSSSAQTAAVSTDVQGAAASSIPDDNVVTGSPFLRALRNIIGHPQAGTTTKPPPIAPFSEWDSTWLNAVPHNHDTPMATKYFIPEFRIDTYYAWDANHPYDHTLGGSTETFRSGEVQLEEASFGGDAIIDNVHIRFFTLYGLWATTTPRNDPSAAVGSWDLDDAYRYLAEAYGGYYFNVSHGLHIEAGIFPSYVGLFSYYNFDNWAYQPSYVSSNTPWFFNGVRVQWFPTARFKIEPWFINGWQSYAKSNAYPGLGGQLLWRPTSWLYLVANNYGFGHDTPGIINGGATINRSRIHTDDSIQIKFFEHPDSKLDRFAISVTGDLGCEHDTSQLAYENGVAVSCGGKTAPRQAFEGYMEYNRWSFDHDRYGLTLGGGWMNNPGRYLTLLPPIDAATAITGTPYFPEGVGTPMKAWDASLTFDWMPAQYVTFRSEVGYRHTNVPYWSGPGGVTPMGGDNGAPQNYACNNPIQSSGVGGAGLTTNSGFSTLPQAQAACAGPGGGVWYPSLVEGQLVVIFALMMKF